MTFKVEAAAAAAPQIIKSVEPIEELPTEVVPAPTDLPKLTLNLATRELIDSDQIRRVGSQRRVGLLRYLAEHPFDPLSPNQLSVVLTEVDVQTGHPMKTAVSQEVWLLKKEIEFDPARPLISSLKRGKNIVAYFFNARVAIIHQEKADQAKQVTDRVFTFSHQQQLLERSLVEAAMAGDADSFGQLCDHYQPGVYRYLYKKANNFADAQDLTQVVLLKAWIGMGRYQPRGYTFGAWISRIAHNELVDYYERSRETISIEKVDITTDDGDPELLIEKKLDSEELRQAILRLTPDQQAVVRMRLQDQDYKEIAQALGKTAGSVKVIYHRAILNLRGVMRTG